MSTQVTATQLEVLQAPAGPVIVAAGVLETMTTTPDQAINAVAAQLEYSFVQPDMPVRAHAVQYESLQVELPGPLAIHASQLEALIGIPEATTPVRVSNVTVEVLRSIPDKKRRPPMNVVAN